MSGIPLIAKIFGIGIILAIGEMVLDKSNKNDVAFGLGLAGIIVVMLLVVPQIFRLFSMVTTTFGM
jgi:stage III sporulation protein AC